MNRNAILALLAGSGVYIYGSLSPDAVALARAIQSGNASDLQRYADANRQSPLAAKALQLAKNLRCPPEKRQIDGSCSNSGRHEPKKGYQG